MRHIDVDKIDLRMPHIVDERGNILVLLSDVKQAIAMVPTEDVVDVRHGEWVIKIDDYDNEYMMCSCCKDEFYPVDEDTVDATPNYCPNCGAKMDGERTRK